MDRLSITKQSSIESCLKTSLTQVIMYDYNLLDLSSKKGQTVLFSSESDENRVY